MEENDSTNCSVGISETIWTQYKSNTSINWNANKKLTINLAAGGFIGSSILIDNLQIIEVN